MSEIERLRAENAELREREAARRWARYMGWNEPFRNVHGLWVTGPGSDHCYVASGPPGCCDERECPVMRSRKFQRLEGMGL
jgi:hypothetical protein